MTIPDRVRSWLFAPGHDEKLLGKVFDVGADEVLLDLEDAVPPHIKDRAREMVASVVASKACWVRVNRSGRAECERDLAALLRNDSCLRLPKVESAADIACGAQLAPGT